MTENTKMQIEINGVKMEIDTRYAKRIDTLKIGDRVKVLTKEYSGYKVSHGVIIGFEPFKELPTIIVAHMEVSYSGCELKFTYYNAQTKDVEVVAATDDDTLDLDKKNVIQKLDGMIVAKQKEINELEERKAYFLDRFKTYWERVLVMTDNAKDMPEEIYIVRYENGVYFEGRKDVVNDTRYIRADLTPAAGDEVREACDYLAHRKLKEVFSPYCLKMIEVLIRAATTPAKDLERVREAVEALEKIQVAAQITLENLRNDRLEAEYVHTDTDYMRDLESAILSVHKALRILSAGRV